LREAVPGYRGRIFAQSAERRRAQMRRVSRAIRSIRKSGIAPGHGSERTLSRLRWYMDGLRETTPKYAGIAFAAPRAARSVRLSRVKTRIDDIEGGRIPLKPPSRGPKG
jgi:hypothetical protein